MAREGNVQLFPKSKEYFEKFDNIRWDTPRPDQRPDLPEVGLDPEADELVEVDKHLGSEEDCFEDDDPRERGSK